MINFIRFFLLVCVWLTAFGASAQNIEDYVSIGSPGQWIEPQEVAITDHGQSQDLDKSYILVDQQRRVDEGIDDLYNRYVLKLNTSKGVEEESNITINFDPSYEKITLHEIYLIRDDQRIKKLDISNVDLYRSETDRNLLIFNKTLQLAVLIPDVRVGDVLDYSYTNSGKNPALSTHYFIRINQQYGAHLQRLHQRVLISDRLPIVERSQAGGTPPLSREKFQSEYNEFKWQYKDRVAKTTDSNRPNWHYGYPAYEFSSFEDWEQVGRFFAEYYMPPQVFPDTLNTIIEDIENSAQTEQEKIRFALQYVQKEIRYFGIELGQGGYIPRPVALTLERRFGDCKDMTFLLTTMLNAMNIDAVPVLVNSNFRAGIEVMIPSYAAFNHIIVRVRANGEDYFVDPTKGEQLGNLSTMEQANFGLGLAVTSNSTGLISVAPSGPNWYREFYDTFNLVEDPDAISFETNIIYRGVAADEFKQWVQQDGLEAVEKSFLDYFQDYYSSIEIVQAMEVDFSNENATANLLLKYKIPDAWTISTASKGKTFESIPYQINADFPSFDGTKRSTPYQVSYPVRTKQVQKFILDDTWSIDDSELNINSDVITYSKKSTFSDNVLLETYEYTASADSVSADDFPDFMVRVKEVRENIGVSLYTTVINTGGSLLDGVSKQDIQNFTIIWIFCASFIAFVSAIFLRKKDLGWRDQSILYPVSLKKFIILSTVTIGIYQYYWIYKNWLWLKTVRNEDLLPGVRSFFADFTNFSLFPRIAKFENGYAWFPIAAIPLAILCFGFAILNRATSRLDSLPQWLIVVGLLGFTVMIPVAMQVLKINENNDDVIMKYSKFDLPAIGLILLFSPVAFLVYWGALNILLALQ